MYVVFVYQNINCITSIICIAQLDQKKITRTRNAQMHTQMLCKTLTPTLEYRYVLDNREDIIKALVVILTIAAASDRVESESVSDDRYRAHVFFLFLQFLGTLQSILLIFVLRIRKHNTNNLQVLDLLPFIVHTISRSKIIEWIVRCIFINAAL